MDEMNNEMRNEPQTQNAPQMQYEPQMQKERQGRKKPGFCCGKQGGRKKPCLKSRKKRRMPSWDRVRARCFCADA